MQLPNDEAVNNFKLIEQRHPHIARNIELFWGHREFQDYMEKIFMDSRDGERQGFESPIAKALMMLWHAHGDMFPHIIDERNRELNVWCGR